jgi:Ca2+-binding RTX toxin-like protein
MALTPDIESGLSRLLGEDEADSVVLTVGQLRSFLDGLWTQGGDDEVQGSSDSELIIGNAGQDSLSGGAGNDTLMGDTDNDIVDGQLGGDLVRGDRNDDIVIGGDDADSLYGGKNNDQLFGGAGNDFLSGDKGSDTLDGGEGSDIFSLIVDELDVIIGFEDNTDLIQLPEGLNFSDLTIESTGANQENTLITVTTTGEQLVQLNDVQPFAITAADFELSGNIPTDFEFVAETGIVDEVSIDGVSIDGFDLPILPPPLPLLPIPPE